MTSRWLWVALLAIVAAAAYGGNVLATPGTGFTGSTLATATFGEIDSHVHTLPADWQEIIKTKGRSDLYVQSNVWAVGGSTSSTGWHTHPGPSFIIVTAGAVTVYDGDDPTCSPHVYSAGGPDKAFVDPGGGHVHVIRNEGTVEARTIAVQLIPAGAVRRQDAPDPGNCPF